MLLCVVLALIQGARAQIEGKGDSLEYLVTPRIGEACGYESCFPTKPGWLNVHMVPQTHSELGHGYNFHQHYTGEEAAHLQNRVSMKRILDAVLTELWNDDRRRFTLSDTAYLFHWWNNRHPTVHRMMYELVRQGRLTIAGGGLSISDEASTSYHAIIDQFTYSLRMLNATFLACARPLVAWAVDVYGHSREFTSLMAQMGFDALFINPISYDDEAARMRRQGLEFLWRGSDDLGATTDMFTHNLFDGYWAPPGFCFSQLCSDPLLVTSSQLFTNLDDRVDKFIDAMLYRQAPNYGTRHVMVVMGHRKAYFDAPVWFSNIDKLMSYANYKASQRGLNVTVFYSNPACYVSAVHDEDPELETKQDDFFPYVHDKDSYTVGVYTSRPTFKYIIREAHVYLQIAKQLQVTANMTYTDLIDAFNWVMGMVQDHSIATGVLRDSVKKHYVKNIDSIISRSTEMMSDAFSKLRESPTHIPYRRCQFNISSCPETRYLKHSIQVYNPLGWPVTMPVRLPIHPVNSKFRVYDADGVEVKSERIRLPEAILNIKERLKADYELVFIATNIPPVGFRSYYVEAQFFKTRKNLIKRVKMHEMNKYLLNVPTEKEKNAKSNWIDKKAIQDIYRDIKDRKKEKTQETKSRPSLIKNTNNGMRVFGPDSNERHYKRIVGAKISSGPKPVLVEPQLLPSEEIGGAVTFVRNQKRNLIQEDSSVSTNADLETTTEEEVVMLPMLRDYLQKANILHKPDYVDTERELSSSDELSTDEPTLTTTEGSDTESTTSPDIEVPIRKSGLKPTTESDLTPVSTDTAETDIIVIRKRTTHKPDIKILISADTTETNKKVPVRTTTTESSIKVPITAELNINIPTKKDKDLDIRVPVATKVSKPVIRVREETTTQSEQDLKVPVRTTTLPIPVRTMPVNILPIKKEIEEAPTTTESLAIVPVRAPTTAAPTTTQSVLVVPVKVATEALTTTESSVNTNSNTTTKESEKEEADITTTTETLATIPLKIYDTHSTRKQMSINPDDFVTNADSDGFEWTTETIETTQDVTTEETSTDVETTTDMGNTEMSSTSEFVVQPRAKEDPAMLVLPTVAKTQENKTDEKYFKVNGGSKLFIGNKYVRVNLNENHRITSVVLSNGVRINLDIQMFYYLSEEPDKFDIRTVPRRTIKPPGAYIFRPADRRVTRMEEDYKAKIIKTSIVEEIHMWLNDWASMVIRLYVDSPVIEVHWLVGPIPTFDGGKDVFIRYATNLEHGAAVYTDSNGRQTLKRIWGKRATYGPLELDPITGNLYPVTSKIYIEDKEKNIRFAVFNDRCQAGGCLVDGAIDLMLHRRILTDDIGFGVYLNETEHGEGIRAAGTHYLYLTKADRNRIFEKKFAKEIAMAPRVLASDGLSYSDDMKKDFYDSKNEFSALREKLPIGVHLLTFEKLSKDELLVRLENYLEKVDVVSEGVKYVALRNLFNDIRVIWLKETTLAANMLKDQWTRAKWRTKNKFYRRFNDFYGTGNETFEDEGKQVTDELGGRGVRLAPQEIRTFIVKFEYIT